MCRRQRDLVSPHPGRTDRQVSTSRRNERSVCLSLSWCRPPSDMARRRPHRTPPGAGAADSHWLAHSAGALAVEARNRVGHGPRIASRPPSDFLLLSADTAPRPLTQPKTHALALALLSLPRPLPHPLSPSCIPPLLRFTLVHPSFVPATHHVLSTGHRRSNVARPCTRLPLANAAPTLLQSPPLQSLQHDEQRQPARPASTTSRPQAQI